MKIIEQSARLMDPFNVAPQLALYQIEYAGRKCYNSLDKMKEGSAAPFIKGLIRRGHTSPLEFGDIMVEIVTSRDVLAELTRHRLASYCVESQRYVAEHGDIEFVRPIFYTEDLLDAKGWCASMKWRDSMERAEEDYHYLLDKCGRPPEDARKTLPNSAATTLVMKANATEWRHILKLRLDEHAYPEMRQLMSLILKELQEKIPYLFDDYNNDGLIPPVKKEAAA